MFGYVRVEKGELKVKEYEVYRGLYCSLCRALSKRYGLFARLILSYDMTFLALVRFSENGVLPSFRAGRCPFNPAKRCNYCTNADDKFDFVCAAAVLMFYYKIKDNLQDEGFWMRTAMYLLMPVAAFWRKRAIRSFPDLDLILSRATRSQQAVEKEETECFDRAAHASADALGQIFAFASADENRALYRFGYAVGRWVYLADAADDIKKDLRRKSYNVFVRAFHLNSESLTAEQKQQIAETLNASIAMAIDAFQLTNCKTLLPILQNVLNEGMTQTTDRLTKGDETK